eukprot:Rhum_TRINITY_DN11814_c0_g1::Rhum_TRINITY_DN11814_c0_g1_i1::g.47226::m.47226
MRRASAGALGKMRPAKLFSLADEMAADLAAAATTAGGDATTKAATAKAAPPPYSPTALSNVFRSLTRDRVVHTEFERLAHAVFQRTASTPQAQRAMLAACAERSDWAKTVVYSKLILAAGPIKHEPYPLLPMLQPVWKSVQRGGGGGDAASAASPSGLSADGVRDVLRALTAHVSRNPELYEVQEHVHLLKCVAAFKMPTPDLRRLDRFYRNSGVCLLYTPQEAAETMRALCELGCAASLLRLAETALHGEAAVVLASVRRLLQAYPLPAGPQLALVRRHLDVLWDKLGDGCAAGEAAAVPLSASRLLNVLSSVKNVLQHGEGARVLATHDLTGVFVRLRGVVPALCDPRSPTCRDTRLTVKSLLQWLGLYPKEGDRWLRRRADDAAEHAALARALQASAKAGWVARAGTETRLHHVLLLLGMVVRRMRDASTPEAEAAEARAAAVDSLLPLLQRRLGAEAGRLGAEAAAEALRTAAWCCAVLRVPLPRRAAALASGEAGLAAVERYPHAAAEVLWYLSRQGEEGDEGVTAACRAACVAGLARAGNKPPPRDALRQLVALFRLYGYDGLQSPGVVPRLHRVYAALLRCVFVEGDAAAADVRTAREQGAGVAVKLLRSDRGRWTVFGVAAAAAAADGPRRVVDTELLRGVVRAADRHVAVLVPSELTGLLEVVVRGEVDDAAASALLHSETFEAVVYAEVARRLSAEDPTLSANRALGGPHAAAVLALLAAAGGLGGASGARHTASLVEGASKALAADRRISAREAASCVVSVSRLQAPLGVLHTLAEKVAFAARDPKGDLSAEDARRCVTALAAVRSHAVAARDISLAFAARFTVSDAAKALLACATLQSADTVLYSSIGPRMMQAAPTLEAQDLHALILALRASQLRNPTFTEALAARARQICASPTEYDPLPTPVQAGLQECANAPPLS